MYLHVLDVGVLGNLFGEPKAGEIFITPHHSLHARIASREGDTGMRVGRIRHYPFWDQSITLRPKRSRQARGSGGHTRACGNRASIVLEGAPDTPGVHALFHHLESSVCCFCRKSTLASFFGVESFTGRESLIRCTIFPMVCRSFSV